VIELAGYRKVLCFFAHPDDETLAAGATIVKLGKLGSEVHIAIPATGIHSRRNVQSDEARASDLKILKTSCQEALGVLSISPERIYLGEFSDNEMDKHTLLELIHWLEGIIRKVNPDLILTHHRYCTNIDHQYCHEAVVVATRPGVNSHIPVLCGEVPSSTGYLRPAAWEPNYYIEVSEKDIDLKCRAMETYIGEARPDPHPRSREVLKALAKVRGSESGFLFAEGFMIQKAFG
jgi:LmbE family N-acetylglucosaminyl deacetylase